MAKQSGAFIKRPSLPELCQAYMYQFMFELIIYYASMLTAFYGIPIVLALPCLLPTF